VGVSNGRPAFYHRGDDRRRGYGNPYGYGLGWYGDGPLDYGWLDADDTDYGDADNSGYGYDGSNDVGPYDDGSGVADDGYGPQGPAEDGPPSAYDDQPIPYTAENARPAPRGNAPIEVTAGPLYNDDAVTLVFKDGRAPETIHNYALTRTTLYVTDGKRRVIPVAALDLAATERVNREAGVDFQLPGAQ
jgi:hypothetical protein